MTETEKKALALVNECAGQEVYGGWGTFDPNQSPCTRALCRAIEQHEAFRQEVSDAVEAFMPGTKHQEAYLNYAQHFARFIIAKPDHVQDALEEVFAGDSLHIDCGKDLRAALAARGGRILFDGDAA